MKKSNAVVLAKDVPNILVQLDDKIKNLKHIEDTPYKTSGQLEGFGNIMTEIKIENLIRAYSSVKGKALAYADASKDLGLNSVPEFTISGGNVSAWKADIMLRIEIINHKETLDKLNSYKDRMSKFLSEEDQKAMLLSEMESFLSK